LLKGLVEEVLLDIKGYLQSLPRQSSDLGKDLVASYAE
jgi:HJR/Mrr/RecB family endonuclease